MQHPEISTSCAVILRGPGFSSGMGSHLGLTSDHSYSNFWGWMEVHVQLLQQPYTVWLFGAQEHMSTKKHMDARNKEMEVYGRSVSRQLWVMEKMFFVGGAQT